MCEMQKLKSTVEQILTAAAEEIFGVFKRSIAEIEEKIIDSSKQHIRNQRLPEYVHQTDSLIAPEQQGRSSYVDQKYSEPPHIKEDQEEEWVSQEGEKTMNLLLLSECPTLHQKLWMVKEEPSLEQQDTSPSPDQVDPEPPHTKEEQNLWTNEEREQLQGLEEGDITKFPSTLPRVKSEYDEDEAQSSQFHQSQTEENTEEPEDGDDYGESEPDSFQNNGFPISDMAYQTSQHQCTEDEKSCKFLSVSETQMTVQPTKRPFCCLICNRGFLHKSKLKRHMLVHTGEKPFNCSLCDKCFAHKSNLKEHMLVHTGEKPFTCSICNKSFAHKGDLNKHISVHTGEKPFCCSICKKCFVQKSKLKRHMSVHTREKPFSCSVCEKCFAHKGDLKKHLAIHTGEKSYCCSVCMKCFVHKSKLKEHISLHTREKPFSCSVCKKGFTYKQNFNKHILIHTGKVASIH